MKKFGILLLILTTLLFLGSIIADGVEPDFTWSSENPEDDDMVALRAHCDEPGVTYSWDINNGDLTLTGQDTQFSWKYGSDTIPVKLDIIKKGHTLKLIRHDISGPAPKKSFSKPNLIIYILFLSANVCC